MLEGSTLRDMNPGASVERIENRWVFYINVHTNALHYFSDQDLRIVLRLTILVLTQSTIRAEAVRNVLMSELPILESSMNNTKVDRMKISVRMLLGDEAAAARPTGSVPQQPQQRV